MDAFSSQSILYVFQLEVTYDRFDFLHPEISKVFKLLNILGAFFAAIV